MYYNPKEFTYYSERFNRNVTVPLNYESDGATGAIDIYSQAWWAHDILKENKKWDDGTECTNWQASWVIYDILKLEGRWFRKYTWFISTLIYGETLGKLI